MKIRSDFVTNSSSSSLIIAKNSECTIDEIRNRLKQHSDNIKDTLFYMDCGDNSVDVFVEKLCVDLYNKPADLKLGDWTISAVEYSSEYDAFSAFMYSWGHKLSTENFKVG